MNVDGGEVLGRRKFTQKQLLTYTANLQTCLIGLESCSGAHFLGRVLRTQGHDVRLIAAQFVEPFVKLIEPQRTLSMVTRCPRYPLITAQNAAAAVERNTQKRGRG